MVMPCEEHTRQNHKIKIGNNNFETVEYFKYLEITLTNQKCIHKEIKSRMNSRNAGYHTAQNLFSSRSLSKNIRLKIYRTINLSVVLYGCESWSFIVMGEHIICTYHQTVFAPSNK
jgi:hypothetical protein